MRTIIFGFNGTLFDTKNDDFYEDALYILTKLCLKYKLALITTGDRDTVKKLKWLNMDAFFKMIKVTPKKRMDHYQDTLVKLFSKPNETILIDDGDEEIKMGNQLGYNTIQITDNNSDAIKAVRRLSELKYLIGDSNEN